MKQFWEVIPQYSNDPDYGIPLPTALTKSREEAEKCAKEYRDAGWGEATIRPLQERG